MPRTAPRMNELTIDVMMRDWGISMIISLQLWVHLCACWT